MEAGASSSAGAGAADLGPDLRSRATRRTSSGNSGDPDRDESPVHRTPGRGRLPHCRIDEFRLTSMDPATCGRGRIDGSAAPAGLGTYGRSCPEPQGSRAGRRRRSKRGCSIRQRHKGIRETQPQFHGGRRDRRGCRGHYGRPSPGTSRPRLHLHVLRRPLGRLRARRACRRHRKDPDRQRCHVTPSASAHLAMYSLCSAPSENVASPHRRSPCTFTTPTARRCRTSMRR